MQLLFGGGIHQDFKKAGVVLIPVAYEATTSFMAGTKHGPMAILHASRQLDELWGEERWHPVMENYFIYTLDEIIPQGASTKKKLEDVAKHSTWHDILLYDKIPFLLGGEHSLTYACVKALYKKYQDFSILHFDAHPDFRDSLDGDSYSHACPMRRCWELGPKVSITSVGIRSSDRDMFQYIREVQSKNTDKKSLNYFYAESIWRSGMPIAEINRTLKEKVYITFDFDAFDPSVMPSVGTPQPGGLHWYPVADLLRFVIQHHTIIGMDVVEFMPIPGMLYPDVTAAKLVWHMIEALYEKMQMA